MPARPKKGLKRKADKGLAETDLEFLICGGLLFAGDRHRFKTRREMKSAYRKNKKFLLSLVGKHEYLPYGTRPWAWWEFEHSEPFGFKKFGFKSEVEEFEFLKKEDLLIPDESKNFFRQQQLKKEEFESHKPGSKKRKIIIDFPEKK
jgi:hypothetical protein